MSTDQNLPVDSHDAVFEEQPEDSVLGTLFTIGLFIVMVVFAIGCLFFGWFQG